jgi:hypothetical protein
MYWHRLILAVLFNILPTLKVAPPLQTSVVCDLKPCVCSCVCPPPVTTSVDLTHFASAGFILATICIIIGVAIGLQVRHPPRPVSAAVTREYVDAEVQRGAQVDLVTSVIASSFRVSRPSLSPSHL